MNMANRSYELVKAGLDSISHYTSGDYAAVTMWQGMSRFAFVDDLMQKMGLDCFTNHITVYGERSWIVELYSILDREKRLDASVYLSLDVGTADVNSKVCVSIMMSDDGFGRFIYRAKVTQKQLEAEIAVIKEAAIRFEMGEK